MMPNTTDAHNEMMESDDARHNFIAGGNLVTNCRVILFQHESSQNFSADLVALTNIMCLIVADSGVLIPTVDN